MTFDFSHVKTYTELDGDRLTGAVLEECWSTLKAEKKNFIIGIQSVAPDPVFGTCWYHFLFYFFNRKRFGFSEFLYKIFGFCQAWWRECRFRVGGGAGAGACMKNDDVVDSLDANQSINQSIVIWWTPGDSWENLLETLESITFSPQPEAHTQVHGAELVRIHTYSTTYTCVQCTCTRTDHT